MKIRLRRMGTRGQPFYRLVVADGRSPRDGRFIETIGYFDPRKDPPDVRIDSDRAKLWLSRGAQPTDTTAAILKKEGILARPLPSKEAVVKEETKIETPAGEIVIEEPALEAEAVQVEAEAPVEIEAPAEAEAPAEPAVEAPEAEEKPARKPRAPRKKKSEEEAVAAETVPAETEEETAIQSDTAEVGQTAE